MKITLEQLKRLIRETVEEGIFMDPDDPENTNNPLNHPHSRDLLKGVSPEELEDRRRQGASVEQGFSNPKPSRHGEKSLSDRDFLPENKIRMIYTNHGILTEEHVRDLKECGYEMEECGSWEVEGPSMRVSDRYMGDEPVSKVVILGLGEGVLEEGGMDGTEGSPGYSGNQVANVGQQGVAGSAASGNPGGANVPDSTKTESFNRRAERLLEAWLEEEVEEELHGDQDELDIAPPFGKLTGADFRNLGKKSEHKKEEHKKD